MGPLVVIKGQEYPRGREITHVFSGTRTIVKTNGHGMITSLISYYIMYTMKRIFFQPLKDIDAVAVRSTQSSGRGHRGVFL